MFRIIKRLFIFLLLLSVLASGVSLWWLNQPMSLKLPAGSQSLDLEIEPGTRANAVAAAVVTSGADVSVMLLRSWFRFSGDARQIKAGSYEIAQGTSPRRLLRMLVNGDESLRNITLVEGWNITQLRAALLKAESLKPDSQNLSPEAIMQALGRPGVFPEGRFFPDTYSYAKGSSDIALLKRAAQAMDKRAAAAWTLRQPDSPLQSVDQLIVLASIVEKETGKPSDRAEIAGVFTNRLRIGMLLQTDPTVIYGLGATFDGNLRKRHLLADSPYNTYTRGGLPPTPIAMPGRAALLAAAQPAQTKSIYFVARGDGSSQFSANLDDHNRAVNKFIRGQ